MNDLYIFENVSMWMMLCAMSIFSAQDIIRKKVNGRLCAFFIFIGLLIDVVKIMNGKLLLQTFAMSIIPGILVYLIAVLTKEKIGKGDAVVIVIIGILTDISFVLESLIIALWIGAIIAIVAIATKRMKGSDTMCFIPFLALGVLINYGM